jgi:hypothetical protein
MFYAHRQTGKKKLSVVFRNFANAPKMNPIILITVTTHRTRTVTSYNEAPWINMGRYAEH